MDLLVYLRDGRTVYLIEGRKRLAQLSNSEPWSQEQNSIRVARGIWNPTTGQFVWRAVRIRHVSKSSISVVEEAPFGIDSVVPPEGE